MSKPILLTSLPRSGSTWTLKVLCKAGGLKALFEPDHLNLYGLGKPGMHPYLRVGDCWDEYHSMFADAFSGVHRPRRPLSRGGFHTATGNIARKARLDRRRVIVKSVFSLHNTLWLTENFDLQVVVLLRNPYSIAHSIHRKWPDAKLGDGILDAKFASDYLDQSLDQVKSAATPFEILASRIGAYYKCILSCAQSHPEWIVITHEALCSNPESEFKNLYKRCKLPWNSQVEKLINETNRPKESDSIKHVNRVAEEEIDKWRQALTQEQQQEIKNYYEIFKGLPYSGLVESG